MKLLLAIIVGILPGAGGHDFYYSEDELEARVTDIQDRNHKLLDQAEDAVVDLINAAAAAKAAGLDDAALQPARE